MTTTSSGRPARLLALASTLVAMIGLTTACSASSKDPARPAGAAASSADAGAVASAAPNSDSVQSAVAAAYRGTNTAPPSSAPPAAEGKKVWVISCGQAAAGCAQISEGAVAAGRKLGWSMTLYDGKLGADNAYATGVSQAVAAKADGIIDVSIDCPLIKQPLMAARAAGIKVVAVYAYDCSDPRYGGGPALFTTDVEPNSTQKTMTAYAAAEGAMKADWVLAKTDGRPVAISLKQTDSLLGQDIAGSFDSTIKAHCPSCQLIDIPFTFADISTGQLGTKVSQALVAHPDANAVMAPYDSLMLLGVAQAIVRSGRSAEIFSIGGEALPPNVALIKSDQGENAATYQPGGWAGWASVDTMIRTFAGQPAVAEGFGLQLVDRSHMPAATNGVLATTNYEASYLKAWGK